MTSQNVPSWRIINTTSGADLGVYQGATADDAIRAMLVDAGAPTAKPDTDLRAVRVANEAAE